MRVKSVIVIVFCFLLSGTAQADQCIHKSDNVVNTSFGSFEQGQLLQEKLRKDCNFIGIQAVRAVDSRRKQLVFVAYDVAFLYRNCLMTLDLTFFSAAVLLLRYS